MALVLDTGALIALERRDERLLGLADELHGLRRTAVVPAGVVAQCWRASPRQHAIRRLLNSRSVTVEPMTEAMAFAIGGLLARSGTADVVDGHVALLARRLKAVILTSDPDDIAALDPGLDLVVV